MTRDRLMLVLPLLAAAMIAQPAYAFTPGQIMCRKVLAAGSQLEHRDIAGERHAFLVVV